MKKVIYKPADKKFAGTIEIEMPSTRQRLKYLKECHFVSDDDGTLKPIDGIRSMEKLFEITEKHIASVDLVYKEEIQFKSFDDLADDSLCDELLNDVFKMVLNGSLGEG